MSSLNVVVNDDHVDNDVDVDHLNLGSKNSDTRATIYINMRKRVTTFREGVKKPVFLGLCPKLWVGGGPKSQTL